MNIFCWNLIFLFTECVSRKYRTNNTLSRKIDGNVKDLIVHVSVYMYCIWKFVFNDFSYNAQLILNEIYRCSVILGINARQNNALPAIDDPIETIKSRSREAVCILRRSFTTSLRRRYELDTAERTKCVLI